MAVDLGSMYVNLGADPKQLITGLATANTAVGGFAKKIFSAKGIAIASFAAIGIAAGVMAVKGVKAFAEVEEGYAKVNTLLEDGQDAQEIYGSFVTKTNIAMGHQGDQLDVLEGLYQTVSAGITDVAEAEEFMEAATMAAVGGSAQLSDVILAGTKVMAAFGDKAGNAEDVMDGFAAAVKAGQLTMGDLATSLPQVSGMAAEMGLSLDETLGVVAGLTKVLGSSAEATTAFSAGIRAFLKPSDDMKKVVESLGYENASAMVETEGFMGALNLLNDAVGGDVEMIGKLFGNVRALKAVFPALGTAADAVNESIGAQADKAGLAKKQYADMSDTMKFKLGELTSTFDNFKVVIGEALVPVIDKLISVLSVLTDWWTNLSPGMQNIIAISVPLVAGIVGIIAVVWLLNTAFLALAANPIVLIIAAIIVVIIAITVAIYKLWTNWDKIWNWITEHKAIAAIIAILVPFVLPIFLIVKALKYLQANWDLIWTSIALVLAKAWNGILSVVEWGVNVWLKTMEPIFWIMKKAGMISESPRLDLSGLKKDTSELEAEVARLKEAKDKTAVDMQVKAGAGAEAGGTIADYVAGGGTLPGSQKAGNTFNITTLEPEETANEIVARSTATGGW